MTRDIEGKLNYGRASRMNSAPGRGLSKALRGLRLFNTVRSHSSRSNNSRHPNFRSTVQTYDLQGVALCRRREESSPGLDYSSSYCFKPYLREISKPKIKLSEEQKLIADYITKNDDSVFFTGGAGTGKSVLLREIIYRLVNIYQRSEVAITASTGISAFEVWGITLHSFAGIRLAREPVNVLAMKVLSSKRLLDRWINTKVLVIDEISMVEGEFFDKLEEIARIVRNNPAPFGGIKVILCGDFMQLPPVSKNCKFVFESDSWNTLIKKVFLLEKVFRQKDAEYIELLSEIREGKVSKKSEVLLKSLTRPPLVTHKFRNTVHLFPLRSQVESFNMLELNKLSGCIHVYNAEDTGKDEYIQQLDRLIAIKTLHLKIGASVMLIKNLTDTLVNGSIGKVISFNAITGFPNVLFTVDSRFHTIEVSPEVWDIESFEGEVIAARKQIPLILAYCMSIHKSQGLTFHSVAVDLSSIFESGQAYVALSRASSLEGLQVLNFHPSRIRINPKILAFNRELNKSRDDVYILMNKVRETPPRV